MKDAYWMTQSINQSSPDSLTQFHPHFFPSSLSSFIHSFSQSVNQLVWQSVCYSKSASKSAHLSQSVSQSLLSISQTVKYCLRQSVIKGLCALGWLGMSVSRTQSVVLSQLYSVSQSVTLTVLSNRFSQLFNHTLNSAISTNFTVISTEVNYRIYSCLSRSPFSRSKIGFFIIFSSKSKLQTNRYFP